MQSAWSEEEIYLIADRAYELALQGRYDLAAVLFDGLVAAAPSNLYARRSLAAILIQSGRYADALKVLEGDPAASRDSRARQLRFEAMIGLGRKAEATAEFTAVRSQLDPPAAKRFALLLDAKQLPATSPDN